MSRFQFLAATTEARNEQLKSGALVFRTIGFGALGVGLWEPLSGDASGNPLLIAALIVISVVLFYGSHRLLGRIKEKTG